MSDIRDMLERTARSADAPPSGETVEADLHRGRMALARRRRSRTIRFSVAGLAALVVLAGATIVGGSQDRSGPARGAPIRLVAYHGDQPEGFVVAQVPDGWYLQGTNAYRLTVAPEGDTTSPDAFEGKLVVMLLSSSAPQELPEGDPVTVGGEQGVVTHSDLADTLTYRDTAGHLVQIQAWRSALHWTNDQLVGFAQAVQVTAQAKAGVG